MFRAEGVYAIKASPLCSWLLNFKRTLQQYLGQLQMKADTYIFWLFEWDTINLYSSYRWYPQYIRTQINENQMIIETVPLPIIIPLHQLESASRHANYQSTYAGRAHGVKLKFRSEVSIPPKNSTSRDLLLAPVDPLGWHTCHHEIDDMIAIITAIKNKQVPTLPENPYQRALQRKGRADEFSESKWNRLNPPNIYNPPPQILRTAFVTFLGLIPVALIFFIIVALLDWLGWI
jgi:hypothetical protein